MTNTKLELKKAIIINAYQNKEITKEQYNRMLEYVKAELEEERLQKKLKEYNDQEILKKYKELTHA
mgnify:CR=1 FL=1